MSFVSFEHIYLTVSVKLIFPYIYKLETHYEWCLLCLNITITITIYINYFTHTLSATPVPIPYPHAPLPSIHAYHAYLNIVNPLQRHQGAWSLTLLIYCLSSTQRKTPIIIFTRRKKRGYWILIFIVYTHTRMSRCLKRDLAWRVEKNQTRRGYQGISAFQEWRWTQRRERRKGHRE